MNITTPLSRHLPQTGDAARSPDQLAASEAGTEQDHYSALVRMLSEVSQDHAQLRTFIYEFARVTLRKKLYSKFLDGAWSEVNEQVRALEAAIDQIEADFQNVPHACGLSLSQHWGIGRPRACRFDVVCKKQAHSATMRSKTDRCLFVRRNTLKPRYQLFRMAMIGSRMPLLASSCTQRFGGTLS